MTFDFKPVDYLELMQAEVEFPREAPVVGRSVKFARKLNEFILRNVGRDVILRCILKNHKFPLKNAVRTC